MTHACQDHPVRIRPHFASLAGRMSWLRRLGRIAVSAFLASAIGAGANPVKVTTLAAPNAQASSRPGQAVDLGGVALFAATGPEGRELWRSDGTPAGTFIVKDIFPGPSDSDPRELTVIGSIAYFSAIDGVNGRELWRTDGTAAGTFMVRDIVTGPVGSFLGGLTPGPGGLLFFVANTPTSGGELWKSDGTTTGTVMVKDIRPGSLASNPGKLAFAGGLLFFSANDGVSGEELWKSDGTTSGTSLVRDIAPGSSSSGPDCLTAVNSLLVFRVFEPLTQGRQYWSSDGTLAGTVPLSNVPPFLTDIGLDCPATINRTTAVFAASSNGTASEIWRTNGTVAGTAFVETVDSTNPQRIREMSSAGGFAYFPAFTTATGFEPWRSDGTAAGTGRIADIAPGADSGIDTFAQFVAMSGNVYFPVIGATGHPQLWRTGSPPFNIPVFIKEFPGPNSSPLGLFAAVGGKLFFNVTNEFEEAELWVSDGTGVGTLPVANINPGGTNFFAYTTHVSRAGERVLGVRTSATFDLELVASDGTGPGTVPLATFPVEPRHFVPAGALTYFLGPYSGSATAGHLWRTDGTPEGTYALSDANLDDFFGLMIVDIGGTLLYTANSVLWRSDGTPLGTYPLTSSVSASLARAGSSGNGVGYLRLFSSAAGSDLWRSDGTVAGTFLLKDIEAGAGSSNPDRFRPSGQNMFFSATTSTAGTELWKTDGTAAGTVLVKDIVAGTGSSLDPLSSPPRLATDVNGVFFFEANDGVNGNELWKSDGTAAGTVLVKDITAGAGSTTFGESVAMNGVLYFVANDGATGAELWKSDGTATGTVMVKDMFPGLIGSSPDSFTVMNGLLYFAATDPVFGRELWRTDGTTAGTIRLADINTGIASGDPSDLTVVGGRLYFKAVDASGATSLYYWTPETPANEISVSPAALTFSSIPLGTLGAPQLVTITNNGSPAATIAGLGASGDFSITSSTCGASLAPGASCTLFVGFAPSVAGARSGSLSVLVGSSAPAAFNVSLFGTGLSTDTTPVPFTFVDPAPVPLGSVVTSSSVPIAGITAPAPVTVIGGQYCISSANGCACDVVAFTANPGTVSAGQRICVRHTASNIPGGSTDTQLIVGGIGDTFTSVTQDPVPAPFVFVPLVNVPRASLQTSGSATITGINIDSPVSIANGEYSIGCTGTFTQAAGSIVNGQAVCVRHTAASTASTPNATTLTIGGVSANFVTTTETTANPARLANISTRMQVLTGNDVLIGGFIIGGATPKTVVVRARGPSLIPFGIANALANPTMQLFSGQTVIAANDDWGTAANAASLSASGFAPSNALESAILITLNPGPYTAVVSGVGNVTGVGIIEVFELDQPETPLANISTRGQVLTGGDVMIGGFIIQGDTPQTVVIRARGPSLIPFGITNALADPVLQLFSGQTVIASSDDWQSSPDAASITARGFAPSDAKESVILITLQPGAYTAIVSGKNGTTGVGIIEVFAQ